MHSRVYHIAFGCHATYINNCNIKVLISVRNQSEKKYYVQDVHVGLQKIERDDFTIEGPDHIVCNQRDSGIHRTTTLIELPAFTTRSAEYNMVDICHFTRDTSPGMYNIMFKYRAYLFHSMDEPADEITSLTGNCSFIIPIEHESPSIEPSGCCSCM